MLRRGKPEVQKCQLISAFKDSFSLLGGELLPQVKELSILESSSRVKGKWSIWCGTTRNAGFMVYLFV